MKKFKTLCGATLLAVSVGANADIKLVDNAELAQVDGQLGLIDTTRALLALKAAHIAITHDKADYVALATALKAHAQGQVADRIADTKRTISVLKTEAGDHLADLNRIDSSITAHAGDHIADAKRKKDLIAAHAMDSVNDTISSKRGLIAIVKAHRASVYQ